MVYHPCHLSNSSQKALFPKPQQKENLTSPLSPKGDNAESKSSKWPPVLTKKIGEHPVSVPSQSVPKEDSAESASSLSPTSKKSENEEQQAIRGGHTNLPDRGLKPLKPPPGKLKVSFLPNENDKADDSKGGSTNLPKPLKLPGVKPIINGTVGAAELSKVQLRKAPGARQSSELIVRHTDGKKFRKIDSALSKISLPAPKKPQRLDNINLTNFMQEYQEEVEKMKKDLMSEKTGEEEMDEVYDDAQSTDVVVRQSGGAARQGGARVSAIPEFTEEEEKHEFYDDCSSKPAEPEENYDDFSEEGPQEEYEAVDEINKPMSPPPSDGKQTKKEKKEKEKDNEMQQNKEKSTNKDNLSKKEKEQKKKEEEKRKIMAKFGIKDMDQKIGDGVVLKDSGGGAFRKDLLAVSKGEIVTILKMTDTPAGKWLVQNANGKIGLVQASNIEVATPTIRTVLESISAATAKGTELSVAAEMSSNMMSGFKDEKTSTKKLPEDDDDEPGEVYEALPEEEGELDDIYEEL
ncbi:FYN-binding protein 1-like isoform X1 [Pomacea canaliculata]|uniref:FYN-binding protein 1-like isoform X1 n=1 Tax=Pomacea canaliculata TaxID=400727 RepID=UPI000D730E4B|nr:FYN-binding protein 1-like isoform X1 [Pomacea canaliculata]XP_025111194.1 FYN-binding protein 1-like isoform X1 [Pomacea canaliculata]